MKKKKLKKISITNTTLFKENLIIEKGKIKICKKITTTAYNMKRVLKIF